MGNITVGGTGKTPHVEYLVNLLKDDLTIGVLSRGYGRQTKGFELANKNSTSNQIGDELFQIAKKYPSITVAACEKRVAGVEKLLEVNPKLQTILLDDAFQHRYIKPGLSVLLIDFNRPIFNDNVLPAGRLRESKSGKKRADIIIVTKTPDNLSQADKLVWIKKLNLFPYQHLFFSNITYKNPIAVFRKTNEELTIAQLAKDNMGVLLVTGIAHPKSLLEYLKKNNVAYKHLEFPDHYNFKSKDIQKIQSEYESIKAKNKIILTTEKDAVRMQDLKHFPKNLLNIVWSLPITVAILNDKQKEFDSLILKYVRENKRIGKLYS
jgi:tetraacyldisaccharide 4'-kinase